jgi:hypothetical protein
MKYQVQVTGEAALGLSEQDFEIDAMDGHHAVEVARRRLESLVPKEGGRLDIVVRALDPWERTVEKKGGGKITESFDPGVVSEFSVELEPHESVRKAVEEKREAAARAAAELAKRNDIESELLEKLKSQGLLPATLELAAVQGATSGAEVGK